MAGAVKEIVATGFLVFRRISNDIQYLLLNASYEATLWTPPKGHVDPGESELETAFRETEEEAGLKKEHLKTIESFKKTIKYNVRNKPKRVVYWLAELKDPNTPITLSNEHVAYKWLNYEEALKQVFFPEMQAVVKEANQYITSSSSL